MDVGKANELIKHYVSVLESQGFYDTRNVEQLLIYCFLVDSVLDGPLGVYLTDEGLAVINRLLRCLSKYNCLIPAEAPFDRLSTPRAVYSDGRLRAAETGDMRDTEDDRFRSTERRR